MEQEKEQIEEKDPTFEDIQKQAQDLSTKNVDLTNKTEDSTISTEQNKEPDIMSAPIPDEWYKQGVPSSLKTMHDFSQWSLNQNKLRGDQGNELGELRKKIAEIENRNYSKEKEDDPVDIESLYLEKLQNKPVGTIAEITQKIIDHELKKRLGEFRNELDPRLSKHEQFVQEQETRNLRNQFIERTKLDANEEKKIMDIINARADKYREQFKTDNGLDYQGILDDAYDRYKAAKYDEIQTGKIKQEQKHEQDKTRAVVSPGSGKPPATTKNFDDLDVDEQEAQIRASLKY